MGNDFADRLWGPHREPVVSSGERMRVDAKPTKLGQWVADLEPDDWDIIGTALLHMAINEGRIHWPERSEQARMLHTGLIDALLEGV